MYLKVTEERKITTVSLDDTSFRLLQAALPIIKQTASSIKVVLTLTNNFDEWELDDFFVPLFSLKRAATVVIKEASEALKKPHYKALLEMEDALLHFGERIKYSEAMKTQIFRLNNTEVTVYFQTEPIRK